MNNLVIPPSPNWYENKVMCCTIDNTLIYGALSDVVVIKPKPCDQPACIKVIPYAHLDRVISVDTNPNWGETTKLAVTAGEDHVIKLWDIEKFECKGSHNVHTTNVTKMVGAVFAGNDKIVSVSKNGFIVIWRIADNDIKTLKHLFNFQVQVTCISSCPHVSWLIAFGLKSGVVVVSDLRKNGKILYKLKSREKVIVSLAWCPTPFNIFPKNMPEIKFNRKAKEANEMKSDTNELENVAIKTDILHKEESKTKEILIKTEQCSIANEEIDNLKLTESDSNENEDDSVVKEETQFKSSLSESDKNKDKDNAVNDLKEQTSCARVKKINPWINLKHADDEEIESDPFLQDNAAVKVIPQTNDFLSECEALKQTILYSLDTTHEEKISAKPIELGNENIDLVSDSELDNEVQEIFQPAKEFLLASSSRGGSIFIWRAGTDGRIQLEIPLGGKSYRNVSRSWITLCWITPNVLLSSSPIGELLQWDLLKFTDKQNIPSKKLIHHDHSNQLFCIAAPMFTYHTWEEETWQSGKKLHAWTFGQDRFLLNTSLLADRNTFVSYPTNGGIIYCLSSSPLDPNRVAVGIGDNTAKIWDLSREHKQVILMNNIWQKIQGKVYALSWHPTKEMILAYGTGEGRIGIIDTNNTSKTPTILCQYFHSSLHKIEWGPLDGNMKNMGLYVCANGKLAVYNTIKSLEDPILLDITNEHVTNMSWKSDFTTLAVGTKIGFISIYNTEMKHLFTVYTQRKSINCLLWHPEATAEDSDTSPCAHWLAVAPADSSILVYDFTPGDDGVARENKIVAVLNGHKKPVRCLAWSSYEGGILVSGGEDGIARVWDVKNNTVISTYAGHNVEPILTALWSPLNKNLIISGGKDNCIRIWNITEHPPMTETDLMKTLKNRSKLKDEVKKHLKKDDDSENEVSKKKPKRDLMLNLTAKVQNNNVPKMLSDCKTLFAKNNNVVSVQDNTSTEYQNFEPIKLFGDRNDVQHLLQIEKINHTKNGKHICNQHLSLWKGDISDSIKDAFKTGNVTPWLISLAPLVSPKLWQEACEIYARKLMDDENADPIEIVSYLLACHKIEEAIQVLCSAYLFREALVIAKCRLSLSDPIINEIIQKWAAFCICSGSYEIAAQCYIVLKEYEEASKALYKRTDPNILEFAIELAEKSGNKDLINATKMRYDLFKVEPKKDVKLETRSDVVLSKLMYEDDSYKMFELEIDEKAAGDSVINQNDS